jgi:hypothetical protein
MRTATKHVFIGILVVAFIYIAYTSIQGIRMSLPAMGGLKTTDGFAVEYASDCTCNPNYVPAKCGDPVNAELEAKGGACVKDTYFCQGTNSPYDRRECKMY